MTNNGKSVLYMLLGLTAGTILGLLFAPRKGTETRETITDWIKVQREKSGKVVTEWKGRIPEQKNKVTAALKAGRDAFKINSRNKEAVEA